MAHELSYVVMNYKTGEILDSHLAQDSKPPGEFTKLMTLYLAFESYERGEIDMDAPLVVSRKATKAGVPLFGLKEAVTISFRYSLRAVGVSDKNDISIVLAEGLAETEEAFVKRMNEKAAELGMSDTTYVNSHGLPSEGQLTTAMDSLKLAQALRKDFPQFFNMFGRLTTDAGSKRVRNANRHFLQTFSGAEGMKLSCSPELGCNMLAAANRGGTTIFAVVFGSSNYSGLYLVTSRLLERSFNTLSIVDP